MSDPGPGERLCGEPASEQVFWPGREPLLCCAEHTAKAKRIAGAMGFRVASRPAPDGMVCGQTVKAEKERA